MSGSPRAKRSALVMDTGDAATPTQPKAATVRVNRMLNCMMNTDQTAGAQNWTAKEMGVNL